MGSEMCIRDSLYHLGIFLGLLGPSDDQFLHFVVEEDVLGAVGGIRRVDQRAKQFPGARVINGVLPAIQEAFGANMRLLAKVEAHIDISATLVALMWEQIAPMLCRNVL